MKMYQENKNLNLFHGTQIVEIVITLLIACEKTMLSDC